MGADAQWWRRPSTWVTVAGNLVPLAGVLFFGWQLLAVMLAFWLDSVAIGIFTAGRVLLARLDGKTASGCTSAVTRVYEAYSFALSYGFTCFVHGVILVGLFGAVAQKLATGSLPEMDAFAMDLARRQETLVAAGAALLTRGTDFVTGYLLPRAYEQADINTESASPYRRAYVLHVALVLGGGLSLALHSPVVALALLVLLKTAGDVAGARPRA